MMRKFFHSTFMVPLVASAAMALVGCSGSGGDDDVSPSPSPTPTPTPTAPPFDDWFRITQMLVGDSSEGVDIDSDGSIDNSIENTLDTIADAIYTGVEEAVCGADGDPACTAQQQPILQTIQGIIDTVFSVDSLSEAINGPIQSGDVNYLLNFEEQTKGGDVKLTWNTGVFKNTGYSVSQTLGAQVGKVDGTGGGTFGPGNLALTFSFANPQSGDELFAFDVVLHQGYTVVSDYNQTKLTDTYTGGAILEQDLLDLVETVLEQINTALAKAGQEPIEIDPILTQISTALEPYSDITIDGGNAFSIGLVIQAETVAVVQ